MLNTIVTQLPNMGKKALGSQLRYKVPQHREEEDFSCIQLFAATAGGSVKGSYVQFLPELQIHCDFRKTLFCASVSPTPNNL